MFSKRRAPFGEGSNFMDIDIIETNQVLFVHETYQYVELPSLLCGKHPVEKFQKRMGGKFAGFLCNV